MIDTCKSCNAEILWAESVNGKKMIFDRKPQAGGTGYVIDAEGIARYVKDADAGISVWTSHYASCPDADSHRKGNK